MNAEMKHITDSENLASCGHGYRHISLLDLMPAFVFGHQFEASEKYKQFHNRYREKSEHHPQGMRQQLVYRPLHSPFPFPIQLPQSVGQLNIFDHGRAIPILRRSHRFRLLRNCPAGNFLYVYAYEGNPEYRNVKFLFPYRE